MVRLVPLILLLSLLPVTVPAGGSAVCSAGTGYRVAARCAGAAPPGRTVVIGRTVAIDRTVAIGVPMPPCLPAPAGRYALPLAGGDVVREFDPPPRPWLPGHRGVDLTSAGTVVAAGSGAAVATPGSDPGAGAGPGTGAGAVVAAAGPGVVAFAGEVAGRGVVSIDHPGGLRTTYEPVQPLVSRGQTVRTGTPVGVLTAGHPGCTGNANACLHWGLRWGEVYLDPLALLGAGPVRLLPAR